MIYLGIVAGIFVLDFFIKRYVDKKYDRKVKHPKLGGFAYIEKYYNDGAMLNLLEKRPGLLKVIQTVFMVAVCVWFYFSMRKNDSAVAGKLGTAFLVGGGLSNLFDRYTKGHVVDYIGFNFGPKWFRRIVFNVSDFFIFIGGVLAVVGHR
ncbi:MAG: signal peptidase II [Lachnospiraceae bacterium]|nr:signal peptidase II [Lachnospiraceae bacterium]